MNEKYQSKLEDIENEVDSFKKKRGRPVGSKKKLDEEAKELYTKADWDAEWNNIEVPTTNELGMKEDKLSQREVRAILIAIAIFLGAVVGMISITPTIIEACKV